jgi:hypothetical protein
LINEVPLINAAFAPVLVGSNRTNPRDDQQGGRDDQRMGSVV